MNRSQFFFFDFHRYLLTISQFFHYSLFRDLMSRRSCSYENDLTGSAAISWIMYKTVFLIVICNWIVGQTFGHVALTYPPARQYDLDFLDNSRTKPPCGMPKGKAHDRRLFCVYFAERKTSARPLNDHRRPRKSWHERAWSKKKNGRWDFRFHSKPEADFP